MKATTKLEIDVLKNFRLISPITKEHLCFANKNFDSYFTKRYNSFHCLECGEVFKNEHSVRKINKYLDQKCPSCNKILKYIPKDESFNINSYTMVLDVLSDYQLFRVLFTTKSLSLDQEPKFTTTQVMTHFISEQVLSGGKSRNFKITTVGKDYFRNYIYFDCWRINSNYSIKKVGFSFLTLGVNLYPKVQFADFVKKRGMKKSHLTSNPIANVLNILELSELETLVKKGNRLAKSFLSEDWLLYYGGADKRYANYLKTHPLRVYWGQIKICLRENYEINNITDYFDYLRMLKELSRDINSPKWICPSDFSKAHRSSLKKLQAIRKKQNLKQLKQEIEKDNLVYLEKKRLFLNLKFQNDKFTIEALKSVEDFYLSAKKLSHCIFENEYYKKENSLCFACYLKLEKTNILVETLEYDLVNMKIIQSRGFDNEATKHNKAILNLFKKNLTPMVIEVKTKLEAVQN